MPYFFEKRCPTLGGSCGGPELIDLNTNTKVVFHTSTEYTISCQNEAIRGRGEAKTELELAELNTNTEIVFRMVAICRVIASPIPGDVLSN